MSWEQLFNETKQKLGKQVNAGSILLCHLTFNKNRHSKKILLSNLTSYIFRDKSKPRRALCIFLSMPINVSLSSHAELIIANPIIQLKASCFNDKERRHWMKVGVQLMFVCLSAAERMSDSRPIPSFLRPLPVRKTRAGLQFSCAATTPNQSTDGARDIWVCNR